MASGRLGQGITPAIEPAGKHLAAVLNRERERWPLWLPVGLGSGVASYFALSTEPSLSIGLSLLFLSLVLAAAGFFVLRRGRSGGAFIILALLFGAPALGLTVAKLHSLSVAAPVLKHRIGPVYVKGRISVVEPGIKGPRITIDAQPISRLKPAASPRRIRIRLRPSMVQRLAIPLTVGDRISILAILMPPPGPAVPGGYDFARSAWFQGIGAVGFAVGTPEIQPHRLASAKPQDIIGQLRNHLFDRIVAALPDTTGGVAAALMTGERGRIPESTMESMRVAGLAHLLAISGLHIGLVAGILFFGVRAGLALSPGLSLRWPIKKWAAVVAFAGAFLYMLLTGATIPTQRAFLMVGLVLAAVLIDRSALSMRLVAFAAVVVLLWAPHSITGPSFQMSFAAVAALIAAFEIARTPLNRLRGEGGFSRRILIYLLGVLLTTAIAGLATAPFALYHFGRLAVFGLAANLGAVPITALWIMPFATLAYGLMPFGLEFLALAPMGWGIDFVILIAETISRQPGAAISLPAMPLWGLVSITLGGLWLIIWRSPWRLAGSAAVFAGLLSIAFAPAPDFIIAGDAKLFAVRTGDGNLLFGGAKGSSFQRQIWQRWSGSDSASEFKLITAANASGAPRLPKLGDILRCDSLGCVARVRGHSIGLIQNIGAIREDCPRSHVIIGLVGLHRISCPGPARIITRRDLWQKGTHAIWIGEDGAVRVENVADSRGLRPWNKDGSRR